jgi:hypothetical protein
MPNGGKKEKSEKLGENQSIFNIHAVIALIAITLCNSFFQGERTYFYDSLYELKITEESNSPRIIMLCCGLRVMRI